MKYKLLLDKILGEKQRHAARAVIKDYDARKGRNGFTGRYR